MSKIQSLIRLATKDDYFQLAYLKWLHVLEDNEIDLSQVDKEKFIKEYINYLNQQNNYAVFVNEVEGKIVSTMYVCYIQKVPKPLRDARYIGYLTSVFTLQEYRNQSLGTNLITYIKEYSKTLGCEVLLVSPSAQSVNFYLKNEFNRDDEFYAFEPI